MSVALSKHARARIAARRLPLAAVVTALTYGRIVHVRGAAVHALGRKEVARLQRVGIDASSYAGVQVVCSPHGTVLTAYRNHDFRGLRPRRRRRAR
jgi:hypothetical protein